MEPDSLAQDYREYFCLHLIKSNSLQQASYSIRHQVYCEELGWESTKPSGMESDEFDAYSFALLLEHKSSGSFAGTVRIVVPPPWAPQSPLPFEQLKLSVPNLEIPDLIRGHFSEISRLAVPANFRRREGEAGLPFVLPSMEAQRGWREPERRSFPHIALGLYMGAISLVNLCLHKYLFAVVEPRFRNRLFELGMELKQGSAVFEHHGTRALYYLERDAFLSGLNPQLQRLYEFIEKELAQQLVLYPYLATEKYCANDG